MKASRVSTSGFSGAVSFGTERRRLCAGAAGQAGVSTAGRAGRQRCHLGADAAGAGRKDARHGQGDAEGLRHRSRLGRRTHGDYGGQARRQGAGHRIQSRHGRAVQAQCGKGRRQRQSRVSSKPICSRAISRKRKSLRCFCCPTSISSYVRRFLILNPARASSRILSPWANGRPMRRPTSKTVAHPTARRISGSSRPRWKGPGSCRRASWR